MGLRAFEKIYRLADTRGSTTVTLVEGLLLAAGDDSQESCAQAAAAAISLLLSSRGACEVDAMPGNEAGGWLDNAGSAVGQGDGDGETAPLLDVEGLLTRVVKIGGMAKCDSLQHKCCQNCVRLLAKGYASIVIRVILATDLMESATPNSSALRQFVLSAFVGAVAESAALIEPVCRQLLLDLGSQAGACALDNSDAVAGYTSFKDLSVTSEMIAHTRAEHEEDGTVASETASRKGGAGWSNMLSRQLVRLLSDAMREAECRRAVEQHRALIGVSILVYAGRLSLEACYSQGKSGAEAHREPLWKRNTGAMASAWSELKTCMAHFTSQTRMQAVADAIEEHDIWSRLTNSEEAIGALQLLAHRVFTCGASRPQLAQIFTALEAASRSFQRRAATQTQTQTQTLQGRAALICLVAFTRATTEENVDRFQLRLADLLLSDLSAASLPPSLPLASRVPLAAPDKLSVRVMSCVAVGLRSLCSGSASPRVVDELGLRLVRVLLKTCADAADRLCAAASDAGPALPLPSVSLGIST